MYRQHFGLKDKPFNLAPDPDYLYLSSRHRIGLAMLEYGLMETAAGLTVISGEVGAGKTTIVRKLLRRIDYREITVGLINNTGPFDGALMSYVVSAFQLPHEDRDDIALFRDFQKFLIGEYAQGRRVVLIVDEAQNLSATALEELRMLTNINADRDQLVQIMLIGQPQLLDILKQPALAQIAQRVSVEYHLGPLDLEEVGSYIRHRLEVAGGQPGLFSEDAIHATYYFSGGVPRLINTLCDYALVFGYAKGADHIDLETLLAVVKGRSIGGVNRHIEDNAELEQVRRQLLERHGVDLSLIRAA